MATGTGGSTVGAGRETPVIRVLPDALVDQIAAGEVVERPASVAKELVENALDAGARRVRIEVRGGGIALLAVTDDGRGMAPPDARLALQRHATSKLATASDLASISTYGFRGEALPAIASVSRLLLRTRARGAAEAFELLVEAGALREARPAAGPEGTRVEVVDLFARVPARRKFLKSAQTEWGHVADWAARVALAQPELHLELVRDDQPALVWPATDDPLARIAAVLSERDAAAMVEARHHEGSVELRALVSRPDLHRPTAESVYLFVNRRPVRDRLLRHALLEPYREVLPRGRFPAAVLFLQLPPDAVDVNVHPAKWEVRFADPRAIHHVVSEAVRQALGRRVWLAGAGPAVAAPPAWRALGGAAPAGEGAPSDWTLAPGRSAAAPGARLGGGSGSDAAPAKRTAWPDAARDAASAPPTAEAPLRFSELRLLGQLQCTYLVVESSRALLLVDQHAAHERVLYERLRDGWRQGSVPRQPLLLPVTIDLGPGAHAALVAGLAALDDLGFDVETFGPTSVVVRAVPSLLAGRDPDALLRGLAEELLAAQRGGTEATPGVRSLLPADRMLATLACHGARRKGDALEPREQRALLDALDEIPWAPCCPHGRPVAVPIDVSEIERRFGRR